MTSTPTNVDSDAEEIELYPEPQSSRTHNDDLDSWADFSIEGEIRRGNKLREVKPAPIRPKAERPKIISLKSTNGRKRRDRQTHKSPTERYPCGCSHWLESSYTQSVLSSNPYARNKQVKLRKKAKTQLKCSMRTAALAVPSKRHCLETWRTKSYLLPDFMIERLKEQVMDERPVVQISDAINCFRYRKHRSNKKSNKKASNAKTNDRIFYQTPLTCVDTRSLGLLFAKRIMQKLSTPLKITLTHNFENLYKVVADDITQLVKYNQPRTQEAQEYTSDISKIVTIWIANILEELKFKLLEEDLIELEEKEGPVLDFLDDVVDKVLDICIPILPRSESDNLDSSSNNESNEEEPNKELDKKITVEDFKDDINNIIEKFNEEPETHTSIDKEYIRNEIDNIIDILFKEHKIKLSDTEYFENEVYDLLSLACKDAEDITKDDNGADISQILSEDADDRSKKVMFSVSDMAEHNSHTGSLRKYNIDLGHTIKHGHERNNENDQTKRNINFSEPNTHLLSNADELWPQDILTHHVLRPSASVTKSIMSLGKLWEKDEKYMTPSQTDASVTSLKNAEKLQDIEILKSMTSLAKLLQDGEMKLLNEPNTDITSKINMLYKESQAEITKSIISLVQILKNDENDWLPEEANAITEILDQLNDELPEVDVTKSIATLLNVLRSNHGLATSADASNMDIINKLALFNDELIQNKEITKSMASLVKILKNDDDNIIHKKLTLQDVESLNKEEVQELHDLLAPILSYDKCDAHSQTDQVKTLEVTVLEATVIGGIDENVQVKEKVQSEFGNELKTIIKNKGIITHPIKPNSDLYDEWKVHPRTAPSWIAQTNAHGEPSEDSATARERRTVKLAQSDIRKWCKDLDKGYKNLEIWRDWLRNACKEATSLIKKKHKCSCWRHKYAKNLIKLRQNVAKDAALWRNMNKHTHETFEYFQNYYGKIEVLPAKIKPPCACKDKYYITQYRNM